MRNRKRIRYIKWHKVRVHWLHNFFFKIITYLIMEELEEKGSEFVSDMFKLTSLYYANDSLLLAQSIEVEQN